MTFTELIYKLSTENPTGMGMLTFITIVALTIIVSAIAGAFRK